MEQIYAYTEGFVESPDSRFATLAEQLAWVQRENTPRREYWTNHDGRAYTYGRGRGIRTYEAQPTHEIIDRLRLDIERVTGHRLEGCFANFYQNSRDWLGWHADDDSGIDHSKPIAVITLGQGRVIQFREIVQAESEGQKGLYGPAEAVMLSNGSLLLMNSGCQHTHQHRIPKADRDVGARISLTYRGLL